MSDQLSDLKPAKRQTNEAMRGDEFSSCMNFFKINIFLGLLERNGK